MKNLVTALILFLTPAAAFAADCHRTCITSPIGVATIQFFEGFSPFVYKDSGGLDTIGYGHLIVEGEQIPQPLLGDAATELLRRDLRRTERGLNLKLTIPQAQHRFDALSSFAFNVGVAACTGSTLFRYTNGGQHEAAAKQFSRWVHVNGKPVRGLKIRRAAEAKIYLSHQ